MAKTVTNATAVYTIMVLIFAVGMWAILAFGSTLRAPPDLAGDWIFAPEGDPRQETLHATIEQSGKFVRCRIGNVSYDLRLRGGHDAAVSGDRIVLEGDGAGLTFQKTPALDVYRLFLKTPQLGSRRFSARIQQRFYPRTPGAKLQQQRIEQQQQKSATQPANVP